MCIYTYVRAFGLHALAHLVHLVAGICALFLGAGLEQLHGYALHALRQETYQHLHLDFRVVVHLYARTISLIPPISHSHSYRYKDILKGLVCIIYISGHTYQAEGLEEAEHVASDGLVVGQVARVYLVDQGCECIRKRKRK